MTRFVQDYAVLRWSVVAAFLTAAVIVVGRLAAPLRHPASARSVRDLLDDRGFGSERVVVRGGWSSPAEMRSHSGGRQGTADFVSAQRDRDAASVIGPDGWAGAAQHESDAAHLLMCLVMLTMLVFPSSANPEALRGVLIAMTVVFAALLVSRMTEGRRGSRAQRVALGYHLFAAAAMWYAMSGHSAGGHTGPVPAVASGLAALFLIDALAVVATGGRQWLGHPGGPVLSAALVPHVVMDLGTAYMLAGAVIA
ncbi:DUF5134 domain-containing protein [Nocardia goodfellowii]